MNCWLWCIRQSPPNTSRKLPSSNFWFPHRCEYFDTNSRLKDFFERCQNSGRPSVDTEATDQDNTDFKPSASLTVSSMQDDNESSEYATPPTSFDEGKPFLDTNIWSTLLIYLRQFQQFHQITNLPSILIYRKHGDCLERFFA